jgi:predicted SAM-dependent methyltransferase
MLNRRQVITVLLGLPVGIGSGYGIRNEMNRHQITEYIRTHKVAKLQLGAGGAAGFSDWLNTDIMPQGTESFLDATKPFPIQDGVLSYVFSEHVVEHLSYVEGQAMMRECYRTLKPGGKIRIATPNLLKLIQLFQAAKTEAMAEYIKDKSKDWPQSVSPECIILNYELRSWGHKFVYDLPTLRQSLERTGFKDIKEFVPGESDDPQLNGLEVRHKQTWAATNDYETMVLQAVR